MRLISDAGKRGPDQAQHRGIEALYSHRFGIASDGTAPKMLFWHHFETISPAGKRKLHLDLHENFHVTGAAQYDDSADPCN